MLTLPPGVRVFVATARVDGRKGIDGLSALVAGSQGHGASSEAIFAASWGQPGESDLK